MSIKTKKSHQSRNGRLLKYAIMEKKILSLSFLFTILTVVSDLLAPYIVSRVLDKEIINGIGLRSVPVFAALMGLYLLVNVLSGLGRYKADLSAQNAATKISAHVRDDVFAHIQRMPISYFDNLPAGKVVSRVTNDTKTLQTLYNIVIADISMAAAYIIFVYASLLLLERKLALLMLLPMSILLFIIMDFRKKSAKYSIAYRKSLSELNASVNENISNMEIIRALGAESSTTKRFSRIIEKHFGNSQDLTKLFSYSAYNAVGTLRYATIVAFLITVGFSSLSGQPFMSVGMIFLFIDYATKIFTKSLDLSMQLGQLERANAAADHIFELLDLPAESEAAADTPSNLPALTQENPHAAVVRFENVSFSYVADAPVLKNVSFDVYPGQTVAIVGNTGSGKSTIMNLLLRFYDVQEGKIELLGRDLRGLDRGLIRQPIAIVQQDSFLFTGNVLENITLNRPDLGADDALRALREVGGQFFLDRHEEGLQTTVVQNGSTFSSGERQLITFARALAQDPSILILDEATSHVDTETEHIIQQGTLRLMQGRTTLIIAHRLSTIKHADLILVLENGLIAERGTHEQLMEKAGIYADMVNRQRLVNPNSDEIIAN